MTSENTELLPDEWIVIFYPQTCAIRLHPTLEAAKQHMSRTGIVTNLYKSPLDFQKRHDHTTLERFWKKICEVANWRWPKYAAGPRLEDHDLIPPNCGTEEFTRQLWKLIQRVGDRVIGLSVKQTRSKDHYELNLAKMKKLVASEDFTKSYPKQCRIIIQKMSEFQSPYVLESELQQMMKTLVAFGHLKTKQDSWLIMQYYRKQLIDDGLFKRGETKEVDNEDDQ